MPRCTPWILGYHMSLKQICEYAVKYGFPPIQHLPPEILQDFNQVNRHLDARTTDDKDGMDWIIADICKTCGLRMEKTQHTLAWVKPYMEPEFVIPLANAQAHNASQAEELVNAMRKQSPDGLLRYESQWPKVAARLGLIADAELDTPNPSFPKPRWYQTCDYAVPKWVWKVEWRAARKAHKARSAQSNTSSGSAHAGPSTAA